MRPSRSTTPPSRTRFICRGRIGRREGGREGGREEGGKEGGRREGGREGGGERREEGEREGGRGRGKEGRGEGGRDEGKRFKWSISHFPALHLNYTHSTCDKYRIISFTHCTTFITLQDSRAQT